MRCVQPSAQQIFLPQEKLQYKGKMPRTTCRITDKGREAFREYVETLRDYIKM